MEHQQGALKRPGERAGRGYRRRRSLVALHGQQHRPAGSRVGMRLHSNPRPPPAPGTAQAEPTARRPRRQSPDRRPPCPWYPPRSVRPRIAGPHPPASAPPRPDESPSGCGCLPATGRGHVVEHGPRLCGQPCQNPAGHRVDRGIIHGVQPVSQHNARAIGSSQLAGILQSCFRPSSRSVATTMVFKPAAKLIDPSQRQRRTHSFLPIGYRVCACCGGNGSDLIHPAL